MAKNPVRPEDSPIRVQTAGEWDNSYTNYVSPSRKEKQAEAIPCFGRNRVQTYEDIHAYQKSKTPEAMEDKRLDAAIQRDLRQRNIK